MNLIVAFIYGIVFMALLTNIIYMIADTKRMRKDMKNLDVFDDHILDDIKQTNVAIELYKDLDERLTKLENKEEK